MREREMRERERERESHLANGHSTVIARKASEDGPL